jgi:uncharacterized protein (DUF736 family)
MATIGTLTRRPDGAFAGSLHIKSYGGRAFLQPIEKTSPNAPDFRLYGVGIGGHLFEAGAAWRKTRQDGSGDYVSVKIDYPELADAIFATLGRMAGNDDPNVFAIIWNRPSSGGGISADPFAGLSGPGQQNADKDGSGGEDRDDDAFAGLARDHGGQAA